MTNQFRIKEIGCVGRIEKANSRIERLEKSILNKTAKLEKTTDEDDRRWIESEISIHRKDIEAARKVIALETEKRNGYKAQADKKDEDLNAIPKVEAVEIFLDKWEQLVIEHLKERVSCYRDFRNQQDIAYRERFGRSVYGADAREFRRQQEKELNAKFNKMILYYASYGKGSTDKIMSDISKDKESKRIDLFVRVSAVCGLIEDASGLYVGSDGNINGVVKGNEGLALVETIGAGGYNIQQYHYRVLVKPIR